jgi:hypothetical protein
MIKLPPSNLPWQAVAKDGYAKLDLSLVAGSHSFAIRRNGPSSDPPGAFVVWHNENRISDRHHMQRPEAIAEAERYFYSLAEFAGATAAKFISVAIERGRQAHRDGMSIYANPFGAEAPVERAQWIEGWLQAFGGMVSAKVINALTATTQANAQLEADNTYLVAMARTLKVGIKYATEELPKKDGIKFLSEWIVSDDLDAFTARWPGWVPYRNANAVPPAPKLDS